MCNVNCNKCDNLIVNSFSGVRSCSILNCGCHLEESNFFVETGKPTPRMTPDVGEDKCPGMRTFDLKTSVRK